MGPWGRRVGTWWGRGDVPILVRLGPGSANVYNHIPQYTTQKRESQHPYTAFTPSHWAPTEPSRNIPTPSQSKQSWPLPEYGAFRYHPTPHFSPRLPFSRSAGSRRSRFIQQSAVRSGPAQHARPSHATGRLGADSPNNRNATVAPRGGRETFIIDRVYSSLEPTSFSILPMFHTCMWWPGIICI